jgi:hypothetical protein
MLEDPKLLSRLLDEEEGLIRVSPYFLFSVLLRQVRRDLSKHGYILELILRVNVYRSLKHRKMRKQHTRLMRKGLPRRHSVRKGPIELRERYT